MWSHCQCGRALLMIIDFEMSAFALFYGEVFFWLWHLNKVAKLNFTTVWVRSNNVILTDSMVMTIPCRQVSRKTECRHWQSSALKIKDN